MPDELITIVDTLGTSYAGGVGGFTRVLLRYVFPGTQAKQKMVMTVQDLRRLVRAGQYLLNEYDARHQKGTDDRYYP